MIGRAAPPVAKPVWIAPIVTGAGGRATGSSIHRSIATPRRQRSEDRRVTDYLNRPLHDVLAPESGIIMFVRALPSLKKGDTLANVGVIAKTEIRTTHMRSVLRGQPTTTSI
jgi:hypothetical protein